MGTDHRYLSQFQDITFVPINPTMSTSFSFNIGQNKLSLAISGDQISEADIGKILECATTIQKNCQSAYNTFLAYKERAKKEEKEDSEQIKCPKE